MTVTRKPFPTLEARIRARLARGAIVTRQGEWVQTEIPGGSIAWSRAEYFNRATQTHDSAAVAVMPDAARPRAQSNAAQGRGV